MKLRLVESAGVGRGRIFESMLRYGKRAPEYSSTGDRVTLTLFDGSYDKNMATLVAQWQRDGREIDLDGLLVLTYLREHPFIDSTTAADLLQLSRDSARAALDRLCDPQRGILERRGQTKSATFHLNKAIAAALLGKIAYTRMRDVDRARYTELVRQFVADHGRITPAEIRRLLGLGDSKSAKVQVSRLLTKWAGPEGFLRKHGRQPYHWYEAR